MREILFEPKPRPRRGGRAHVDQDYEADNDTELDTQEPVDASRRKVLHKLDKLIEKAPARLASRMTYEETDKAIADLIEHLAEIRTNSFPRVFDELWDQHLARLGEIEAVSRHTHEDGARSEHEPRHRIPPTMEDIPAATQGATIAVQHGLSNEPFQSRGNPQPQRFPRYLPPQLPMVMSVFITTSPPESLYTNQAYHWPDAPVRMQDQTIFFEGLAMKIKIKDEDVRGYVFSYGWCDVCRWISRQDERDGWGILQVDLRRAADRGLRNWRMKVLAVGR